MKQWTPDVGSFSWLRSTQVLYSWTSVSGCPLCPVVDMSDVVTGLRRDLGHKAEEDFTEPAFIKNPEEDGLIGRCN